MKTILLCICTFYVALVVSCTPKKESEDINIIFLHHSTGNIIWNGKTTSIVEKMVGKISKKLANSFTSKPFLPSLFEKYNQENHRKFHIKEITFPKSRPYGWNNFPYDYYNIWVKNSGNQYYMKEPTLEKLTNEYDVIIFKHCFPVSNIQNDLDSADINSNIKTITNYKLQYLALKNKIHEFPETKFILFTGAVQVKSNISEDEAKRTAEFFNWVINEWDQPGDNIFLWDLYNLQTEGGLYFKDEYAQSFNNSHPNTDFAKKASKLLFERIINIVEDNGNE